jgi:hypothetical protein
LRVVGTPASESEHAEPCHDAAAIAGSRRHPTVMHSPGSHLWSIHRVLLVCR